MLDTLKSCGGPFTDSEKVEKFLNDKTMDNNAKQKRMKLEVQFARESTTLLTRVDPLFQIKITLPTGKRRMKTAFEFGNALMSYLGRKKDRTTLEYDKFQQSLDRLASA